MATYTTSTGIKKITPGDESGAWGDSLNTNFDILDAGLSYGLHDFASDANVTLTIGEFDTGDPAGSMALKIDDTGVLLTAGRDVTLAPGDCTKMWIILNSTAQTLTIKQGSGGSSVAITAGYSAVVYADGGGGVSGNIVNVLDNLTLSTLTGHIIGTDIQAQDAGLQSIAGLTTAADKMIYTDGSDSYVVIPLTAAGRALIDDADAAAQRTTLSLVLGTDVQAYDAFLLSLATLGTAADKMIYTTGVDTAAETALTAAGRALIDDADAAAQRATLGLAGAGTVTDNALSRFNGTDGYTLQESPVIVGDNGEVSGAILTQVTKTADYTFALADNGKEFIFDGVDLTVTVPANVSVAFTGGTRIELVNLHSTDLSIAITTDIIQGAGVGDLRSLAQKEGATLTKLPAGLELEYNSGGTTEIVAGDIIEGLTSGATAKVVSVVLDSGVWASGTAVGQFICQSQTGTFTAEFVEVGGSGNIATVAGGGGTSINTFWLLTGGLS